MGKAPKEDPQDKAARLRERRISQMERDSATQRTAGDLTGDLRSVYGLRGLPLTFGSAPAPVVTPGAAHGSKFKSRNTESWADRNVTARAR